MRSFGVLFKCCLWHNRRYCATVFAKSFCCFLRQSVYYSYVHFLGIKYYVMVLVKKTEYLITLHVNAVCLGVCVCERERTMFECYAHVVAFCLKGEFAKACSFHVCLCMFVKLCLYFANVTTDSCPYFIFLLTL